MANTSIETSEEIKNIEKQKNEKYNKSSFLRNFVKTKLKEKNNKIDFINKIMDENLGGDEDIPQGITDDLKRYLILKSEYKANLKESEIEKIKVSEIRNILITDFLKIRNLRDQIKKLFLKEYDISEKDYEDKLSKEVKNQNEKELLNLNNNINSRKKFIEKYFYNYGSSNQNGSKTPNKRDIVKLLNGITLNSKITKKLESLEGEDKDNFILLIKNFKSLNIDKTDIEELFSIDILTENEKREILYIFIPSITLLQAKTLGLIDDIKSLEIRENIVKDFFKNETNINYELIAKQIDEESVIISTKEITKKDSDFKKLYSNLSLDPISDGLKVVVEQTKENIEKEGPKSFENLKMAINEDKEISQKFKQSIDKLISGNVLRFEITDSKGNKNYTFSKIGAIDIGKNKNLFELIESGEGNIYFLGAKASSNQSYQTFIKFLKSKELNEVNIFTEKEIENKQEFSTKDVSGTLKLIDEDELEKQREDAMELVKKKKKELVKEGKYKNINSDGINDDPELKGLNDNVENLNNKNINALITAINGIDSEGEQYGLEKGTTFVLKKNKDSDYDIWTIADIIDYKKIILTNGETIDLQNFYENFKAQEATRITKVNGTNDFLSKLGGEQNIGDEWNKYSISSSGKLKYKREENDAKNLTVKYLEGGKKYLEIYSIGDDGAEISFGDIESKEKVKKPDGTIKEIKKLKLFKKQKISLGHFYTYIKKYGLAPVNNQEEIQPDDVKRNTSFFSRLFQNKSLAELMQAGKIVTDSLQKYLTEGKDDHAAKIALGLFGNFMPTDLKMDLKSRVQQEQRKSTDAYMEKLKGLDSDEATKLIEKWLLNKNSPQYKLEAAVLFMYKEYGSLYAKDLSKYSGTFLWYKVMGGTPHDKLYKDIKGRARAKSQGVSFTEEELVYELIKRQCREKDYRNYGGILRRSRLHKDIKGVWAEGIQSEINKGYKDAEDTRSVTDMNGGFYGEVSKGTYANSLGWIKKIGERGGSLEDSYEAITALLVTGAIYNMDQKNISKNIKDWHKGADGRPIMFMDFTGTPQDADLFNETFLEVCKSLGEKNNDPELIRKGMYFYNNKEKGGIEGDKGVLTKRVKEFEDFWSKYGKLITRTMLMLNGADGKNNETDKIILLEKDKPGKEVFGKYIDRIRFTSSTFNFASPYFSEDWTKGVGMSGLSTYDAVKQTMVINSGNKIKDSDLVTEFGGEIIREARRVVNGNFTLDEKRIQLKVLFKDVIAGLYSENPSFLEYIFNDDAHAIAQIINNLGLDGLNKNPSFDQANALDITGKSGNIEKIELIDNEIDNLVNNYIDSGGKVENNKKGIVEKTINSISQNTNNVVDLDSRKKQEISDEELLENYDFNNID